MVTNNLEKMSSLPIPILDFGGCYLLGHLFIAGGYARTLHDFSNESESLIYEISSNKWTILPKLNASGSCTLCPMKHYMKIYAFFSGSTQILSLDI